MNLRIEVLPGLYLAKKNTIDNGILNNIQGIKKVINVQDDINEIIGISKDYTNVAIKNELIKYSKKKLIEYLKNSADTINQCYNECLKFWLFVMNVILRSFNNFKLFNYRQIFKRKCHTFKTKKGYF